METKIKCPCCNQYIKITIHNNSIIKATHDNDKELSQEKVKSLLAKKGIDLA